MGKKLKDLCFFPSFRAEARRQKRRKNPVKPGYDVSEDTSVHTETVAVGKVGGIRCSSPEFNRILVEPETPLPHSKPSV